jgi:hypothetical protein
MFFDDVIERQVQRRAFEVARARGVAPAPHHPDQTQAFPSAVETTFGPMEVTLVISLHRTPRQKCTACGKRRVCFYVGLGDTIHCPSLCAKCAGIR